MAQPASASESDDEDTPKPLRFKVPQDSRSAQSRIPQRSSSFYFASTFNLAGQVLKPSQSSPTPLIQSPTNSHALIVNKSRRSDTTKSSSHGTVLSTRRLSQTGSRSPSEECTAMPCHGQSRQSTWSNNVECPAPGDTDNETKTGGGMSRYNTYKQKFLHRVGLAYCAVPTSDENLADRSRQLGQPSEACLRRAEQDTTASRRSSNETHGSAESAIASLSDYPSPLSTPTRSSFTSRTTTTSVNIALESSGFPAADRGACPILVPKVSFTPELDSIVKNHESSMFVAVDIDAVTDQPRSASSRAIEPALDLVIVVDNSSSISATSLTTSREVACYLSSQLRCPRDRLAILSTHGFGGLFGPRILLSMGPINIRQVREAIDTLFISTEKLGLNKSNALDVAVQLVMNTDTKNGDEHGCYRPLRHVVVLSPNSEAVSIFTRANSSVGLHFINSGVVSWNLPVLPLSRGWIISHNLSWSFSITDLDCDMHSQLRDMLVDLRWNYDHGKLINISIKVESGYKCQLQGIMGETAFLELSPGEKRTLLAKIQTGPLPDQQSRLLHFPSGSRTTSGGINIEKELENIIGDEYRTILSVAVQYENSLLPNGTVCTYRADARIPQYVRHSGGFGQLFASEATLAAAAPLRNSAVQQRLISHIASHQPPGQALATLANDFGSSDHPVSCATYLEFVIGELKHQVRSNECSEYGYRNATTANARHNRINYNSTLGRPLSDPAIPTRCASSHQTGTVAPRPVTRSKGHVPSPADDENTDTARRIWLELRKNSRGAARPQRSLGLPDEQNMKSLGFPVHEWKRIQSIALSNKRSLGQDSMRSLSYAGTGNRATAPWL